MTRRGRQDDEAVDAFHVNQQLGRAREALENTRTLFITVGAGIAVLFLVAFVKIGSPSVLLMFLLYGVPVVVGFSLGAILLPRAPFAWALGLAILMSPYALFSMWFVPDILRTIAGATIEQRALPPQAVVLWIALAAAAFQVVTTVFCWVAAVRLRVVRALVTEHADLPGAQRILGTRGRAAPGEVSQRAAARRRNRGNKDGVRLAAYAGGAVLVTVALVVLPGAGDATPDGSNEVHAMSRADREAHRADLERRLTPVLAKFVASWHGSDRAAVLAMVPEALRAAAGDSLDKGLQRYGFDKELPRLEDQRALWPPREPNVARVYFDVPAATTPSRAKLRTEWRFEGGAWALVEIGLRRTTR